jgi:hypothetical protein
VGGSGSSNSPWTKVKPTQLISELRTAEVREVNATYVAQVNDLLATILADANNRPVDAINVHLDEVGKALEKEIAGTIELRFGGSVAKRTYVEGISDVDALVVLNDSSLARKDPQAAIKYIVERLGDRFKNTKITTDGFAINVEFADARIQLVPVKQTKNILYVPDASLRRWVKTYPREFTQRLQDTNAACSGRVVPVIKLAKAIMAARMGDDRLTGFHTESLAIETFTGYKGDMTYRGMLQHFFSEASRRVLTPTPDPTGQTESADGYLGPAGSTARMISADKLDRVARKLRNADADGSIEAWEDLFD